MTVPSRPIAQSQESQLLSQISKQLDQLIKVSSKINSGVTTTTTIFPGTTTTAFPGTTTSAGHAFHLRDEVMVHKLLPLRPELDDLSRQPVRLEKQGGNHAPPDCASGVHLLPSSHSRGKRAKLIFS